MRFLVLREKPEEEKVYYASMCHLLCLSMHELLLVSLAVCMMLILLNCK